MVGLAFEIHFVFLIRVKCEKSNDDLNTHQNQKHLMKKMAEKLLFNINTHSSDAAPTTTHMGYAFV